MKTQPTIINYDDPVDMSIDTTVVVDAKTDRQFEAGHPDSLEDPTFHVWKALIEANETNQNPDESN